MHLYRPTVAIKANLLLLPPVRFPINILPVYRFPHCKTKRRVADCVLLIAWTRARTRTYATEVRDMKKGR